MDKSLEALHSVLARFSKNHKTTSRCGTDLRERLNSDEEFCQTHMFIVKDRMYAYLAYNAGFPVDTNLSNTNLSEAQINQLVVEGEVLLHYNKVGAEEYDVYFDQVRDFYLNFLQHVQAQAIEKRKALEDLERTTLKVMVFFKETRPLFLSYSDKGEPRLVENKEEAFEFKSALLNPSKNWLEKKALEFEGFLKKFDGVRIKVIM